jgi:hypothetical protein
MPSSDEHKRTHDELVGALTRQQTPLNEQLKRLTGEFDRWREQQEKGAEQVHRQVERVFQPVTDRLDGLSRLPKQIDELVQCQVPPDVIRSVAAQVDQLTHKSNKQPDLGKEIDTAVQPLSHLLRTVQEGERTRTSPTNERIRRRS